MNTEMTAVQCIDILDAPGLDPITVFLRDKSPRKGSITITCFGQAWTAYWGAMGCNHVREFVLSCGDDYVANSLSPSRKTTKREDAYLLRIVKAVREALRNGAA